jgi:hypothetical protein
MNDDPNDSSSDEHGKQVPMNDSISGQDEQRGEQPDLRSVGGYLGSMQAI